MTPWATHSLYPWVVDEHGKRCGLDIEERKCHGCNELKPVSEFDCRYPGQILLTSKACRACEEEYQYKISLRSHRCVSCGEKKPASKFGHTNNVKLDGTFALRTRCKDCAIILDPIQKDKIRETRRVNSQTARAINSGLPASLTVEWWKAILKGFDNKCAYCEEGEGVVQDHFFPLNPRNGNKSGGYVVGNIVPACQSCNSRKGNKDPFDFIGNVDTFNLAVSALRTWEVWWKIENRVLLNEEDTEIIIDIFERTEDGQTPPELRT